MACNTPVMDYGGAWMHNRSDQFAKNILREALSRASIAETEVEVLAATQKIDVFSIPDPAREAERKEMGMLGELSAEPSLFEHFSRTPSLRLFRRCLRKQLTWYHELERRASAATGERAPDTDPEATQPNAAVPFPALVITSAGRPETVLEAYGFQQVQPGLYYAVPGLVTRIVVLGELLRTRETLLLRLLGSGRVLREALEDLSALPDDAWEKSITTPLLVHFRLASEEPSTSEEDDVSAEIRAWFKEYEQNLRSEARKEGLQEGLSKGLMEGLMEGLSKGLSKGLKEGERTLLLRLLRARFGELPETALARIEAAGPSELEQWGERVLNAQTLDDVLGNPS